MIAARRDVCQGKAPIYFQYGVYRRAVATCTEYSAYRNIYIFFLGGGEYLNIMVYYYGPWTDNTE